MSHSHFGILFAIVLSLAGAGSVCGQSGEPTPAGEVAKAPAEQLTEQEIEKLSTTLAEWRTLEAEGGRSERAQKALKKAQEEFKATVEQSMQAHQTPILAMIDSWSRVLANAVASDKKGRPAGLGRVRDEYVNTDTRGREIGFDYAIYLPSGYDGKKSWPLIIGFHDKGSDGRKYLNEVWMENRELKELRDNFIILAPTIGERTAGKNKADQVRISWFDRYHVAGITRPLVETLTLYNVDTDRMYLDGVGEGARTALQLGMMYPRYFAAIVARNAGPSDLRFLANLKNQASVTIVTRKDGPFSTEDGKLLKDQILQAKEVHGLDLAFKELEPLEKSKVHKALGTQQVDPVHDASADILNFFLTKKRNLYEGAVHFATPDIARFKLSSWVRLDRGDAVPADGTIALVEASIDRATNTIDTKTQNVERFRIYLNDALVDLDRPVKVKVNGKEVIETKVDRSLDYLLTFNRENPMDPSVVLVGELAINVPPPEEPPPVDGEKPGSNSEGDESKKD